MKFAKELEQDLVPEWRAKYFDYKTGKKKIKAVTRALRNVEAGATTPGRRLPANILPNSTRKPSSSNASIKSHPGAHSHPTPLKIAADAEREGESRGHNGEAIAGSLEQASPIAVPKPTSPKTSPRAQGQDASQETTYGSFIPSPSSHNTSKGPPSLSLPDPAMPAEDDAFAKHHRAWQQAHHTPNSSQHSEGKPGDAYSVGKPHTPTVLESTHLLPRHQRFLRPHRSHSQPHHRVFHRPQFFRRIFSHSHPNTPAGDVPMEVYRMYDEKNSEFFNYLDSELKKIDSFYKMKETQANHRLQALRDQLHEMRDRRLEEIRKEQDARKKSQSGHHRHNQEDHMSVKNKIEDSTTSYMKNMTSALGIGPARVGKTSKALQKLGSPHGPIAQNLPDMSRPGAWQDFTRRLERPDIPYRAAKRKLKLALQEFYRGLELLKSYALLNRTAFRKINKKYDKATNARPTLRYMTEKVNKAWFVQSEVLDHQLVAVEDLYARYFERGNHKIAVGKLRSKTWKSTDYTGSVFRNGLLIAGGLVFGVQGIVYGAQHIQSTDDKIKTDASYLMQIYGGYFLMLFLFLLFCLDCRVWNRARINYPFIFEFDARHFLNWQQLAELPCFFLFLLGLCMWLNFQQNGTNVMFLYWPVALIGISALILFCPGPILYHRSRGWFAYSNFRLLLAGLYPVEFRDFFLGDMYCSQTYSMGNIELFFCLYANNFINPAQCNSSHSRLIGFFSCLPAIWRALQCLRRYYDTRNAFPHLVNCGKYTFTILSYMTLSLYRIDENTSLKALFIACSTINSTYCSIWDLAMDWSLLNPYAKHPFLRDVLGFKRPQVYYGAMILDPILRFNWIFYAIYGNTIQHSAIMSFMISFSEVCRRGIWSIFRVENEHCTNVGRFRASRDVPLPYDLPTPSHTPSPSIGPNDEQDDPPGPMSRRNTLPDFHGSSASSALEAQQSTPRQRLRRSNTLSESETPIIRGIARVGTVITQAHAQDFERKRPKKDAITGADQPERSPHYDGKTAGYVDSSDDEEDDDEEVHNLETAAHEEAGGPIVRARNEGGDEGEAVAAEGSAQSIEDMLAVREVLGRRRSAVE